MSSGGGNSDEQREQMRQERLKEALRKLKVSGNAWTAAVSERKERPSQQEWELWHDMNAVLRLL